MTPEREREIESILLDPDARLNGALTWDDREYLSSLRGRVEQAEEDLAKALHDPDEARYMKAHGQGFTDGYEHGRLDGLAESQARVEQAEKALREICELSNMPAPRTGNRYPKAFEIAWAARAAVSAAPEEQE
jgi:hypothetical protein